MKIAVTGGRGFVGANLSAKLKSAGHEVVVLSRKNVNYDDVDSIACALSGCDAVFHLAAAIFAYNYAGFERANVELTRNIVAACNNSEVKKFILVSSLAAAGFSHDADHPRTEKDTPAPSSDYGITKLGAEKETDALKPEIKRVIFRPPIVYGKNDSGVSKIAAWVKRGIMVNTSNPEAMFSFVYADDLTDALCLALADARTDGETFFICEGNAYSWKFFIEAMARAMGKRKPLMISAPLWLMKVAAFCYETLAMLFGFEPALNYDKIKEADINGHWICSNKKWETLTEQKFTPLEEGLKKSFD